jgi:hypothetical protein
MRGYWNNRRALSGMPSSRGRGRHDEVELAEFNTRAIDIIEALPLLRHAARGGALLLV